MISITTLAAHLLVATTAGSGSTPTRDADLAGDGLAPETAAEVIEAMIERYVGLWYRDFTFVQTTSFYDADEKVARTETWYESIRLPGKLRIDVAPLEEGRVLMFNDDVFYQFRGGELQSSNPQVHPLLLMGFDLYFLPLADVLEKLKGLGVDMGEMHESTWQGRPVYVLGADEGDATSHQFWIDQERLVFVREVNGDSETRFNEYERLGRAWVSPEVVFMRNGKVTTKEEYHDMSIERALDDSAFLPEGSVRPTWIPPGA